MSLRALYPTFSRIIPACPAHLKNAARRALHLILLRWWTWRLTRRLLFAGAAFATLLAAVFVVENWRGRRAFDAVAREAASMGLSFNLRDHAQPPVPDDQNLAKTALLDAPNESVAIGKFWSELSWRFQLLRIPPPPETYNRAYTLPDAGRPDPLTGTPADLAAFRAAVDQVSEARDHESMDAFLARTAPLLAELGAEAARRPYLIYERDWDDPMNIIVPEVGPMRDIARAASIQALVALSDGRPAAAADALALPLRLRTAVQRDPTLISNLTAVAMDSIALAVLWQGLTTHAWTAAELDRFATLLADDRTLESLRRACAAETAWSVSIPLQLPKTIEYYPSTFGNDQEARLFYLLAHWAPYGWLQQNAAGSARIHLHESLPCIDLGAARIYPDRTRPLDQRPRAEFPPYDVLTRLTQPSLQGVFKNVGVGKTRHDLARLAVALEKHLLARGAYPDSLAPVLATDPALAALHDPFDGQPYRYRRDTDGGFTLWGVGQNLRDDGGAFPDASTAQGSKRYETGDLVWRVPGR